MYYVSKKLKNTTKQLLRPFPPLEYEEMPKGTMNSGFVQIENELLNLIVANTGYKELITYIRLLAHYNFKRKECFPTIETLCFETGLKRTSISYAIQSLIINGFLIVAQGGNKKANNFYFPCEYFFNPYDEEMTKKLYENPQRNAESIKTLEEILNDEFKRKEKEKQETLGRNKKMIFTESWTGDLDDDIFGPNS